jgi:hypothetical protein
MEIPTDREIIEGPLGLSWYDDEGIMHTVFKDTPITLEKAKASLEFVRQLNKGKKIRVIADSTFLHPQDKETKEYTARELPRDFSAVAVITHSHIGRIITNIFLKLIKKPLPIKMFLTEGDAKQWLRSVKIPSRTLESETIEE